MVPARCGAPSSGLNALYPRHPPTRQHCQQPDNWRPKGRFMTTLLNSPGTHTYALSPYPSRAPTLRFCALSAGVLSGLPFQRSGLLPQTQATWKKPGLRTLCLGGKKKGTSLPGESPSTFPHSMDRTGLSYQAPPQGGISGMYNYVVIRGRGVRVFLGCA